MELLLIINESNVKNNNKYPVSNITVKKNKSADSGWGGVRALGASHPLRYCFGIVVV